ncbi:60S ribosomal protein L17-2-like [Hibiscus syriacus]|uniref:60S ribosomal protein L17-2-like n=1 Tax=Hibiscus syriacus TaxID=106335 RepID=A0A6A3A4F3_HIBSY|nr:60S ribosomal protein L17-2-like [Hibiscus syriacus]
MPITSFSLFRYRSPTITTILLRYVYPNRGLFTLAAKQSPSDPRQQNASRRPPPNKNLLKAKHVLKDFSSLAPALSPNETPTLSESQAIGTVAASQANFRRVIVQPDVLKKIKRKVLVGDKVVVGSIDLVDRLGVIENVFQRSSEISDPPVANVDHFLVLFSMEQPRIEPFTLTRFLVEAESTGIPLTLALNKTELVDEEVRIQTLMLSYGTELSVMLLVDYVFIANYIVETKNGIDSLAFYLRDQTTVIVGPSGVGKSSLINVLRSNHRSSDALEGDNWFDDFDPILGSNWFEDQRVGEVSTRSGRGKHNTRHVSLLPLSGGGFLADSPGFNQPSLLKVTKHSLAQAFPEVVCLLTIRKMLKDREPMKCSFNNCLHIGEPGCIVKGDWERYPYYFQLLDEIRIKEEFQLRMFGTKREGDIRYKVGDMGIQRAEPRLEPKKHRRQSRKRINQSILNELDELDDDDSLDLENDPIVRAIENENQ